MNYKIMIAGSRDFQDYELLKTVLKEELDKRRDVIKDRDIIIVSGEANGADKLGERYARENKFKIEGYPALWNDLTRQPCKIKVNRWGKEYNCLAGHNRNRDMVKVSDLVILFHINNSPGTRNDLELVKEYNKDCVYKILKKEK